MKYIILVFILFSCDAFAYPSGNDLLGQCKLAVNAFDGKPDYEPALQAGTCIGYIAGIYDSSLMFGKSGTKTGIKFCLPSSVTIEQLIRVVVTNLERKPEYLHLPSGALVVKIFASKFPCSSE